MRYLIHSYPRTGSTALIYLLWRYKFQNINETTLSPIFNEILDYRPVKKDKTIFDLYQLGIPPVDTMHPNEYLNQLEEVLNEDFDNIAIKNFPRYHEIYSHETSKFCHFINDKFDLTTVALYRRDVLDTALSYALASANGVWNINNFLGKEKSEIRREKAENFYLKEIDAPYYIDKTLKFVHNIETWWTQLKTLDPVGILCYEDIFIARDTRLLNQTFETSFEDLDWACKKILTVEEKQQRIEFFDLLKHEVQEHCRSSEIITEDLTINENRIKEFFER